MRYIETREIPLDDIEVNMYHLREETKAKPLDGLKHSIEKLGLVHPVVVRKTPGGVRAFTLVAGERRFLAHQELGRKVIRADVWEASDEEAAKPEMFERTAEMMTIVSNIQVEPLHLFEMGRRFLGWMRDFGMSDSDVAEALDVPVSFVREAVRPVEKIHPDALKLIEANVDKVQRAHIDRIADEADRTPPEGQLRIVRKIIEQDDKELVQRPAKLPEVARSVRRELRHERRQAEAAASAAAPAPQHSDEFKRKKLFDDLQAAEEALARFKARDLPELSLVDLKSIEARVERLGRAWPEAGRAVLEAAEKSAVAKAVAGNGDGKVKTDEREPVRA